MEFLRKAIHLLDSGKYTCVLCDESRCITTQLRGVRPLVQWLNDPPISSGFCAADRVIGKATAFLYCLLGAKAVYAKVLSRSAQVVLEEHNVIYKFDVLTEFVENRTKDGMCPFEKAVMDISDPHEALRVIYLKMEELGIEI